ncbi:MAG: hypothetical protein WAV90_25090 [Gordonia amarae]
MAIHRWIAAYTDGTLVRAGDRIRYRQQPGGLMGAYPQWREGVASRHPKYRDDAARREAIACGLDVDELVLLDANGNTYTIAGHIVERL